jgi:hypothetical protein
MAFDTLNTDFQIGGGGSFVDSTAAATFLARFGAASLPLRRSQYTFGTGDYQANAWYVASRTVTATTADNINLTSLSFFGTTFSLTKLKYLYVAISNPDGTKSLLVGPRGVSNAVQLGWGGTGATVYDTVYTGQDWERPHAGWTVTATTADILGIYNPGASSVTYGIWILGLD